MNKHLILAALAAIFFFTPAQGQRLSRRPCPQRAGVNQLREQTRQKEIASRIGTKAGEAKKRYGLIILAAFKNQDFTVDKSYFETLINGSSAKSALSYFNEQWKGYYEFHFDITDIVRVEHDYSYYGKDMDGEDARPEEMIIEACKLVDKSVDFSKYDNDGDGEVDNVFVFYAGDQGEGYDDRVWPHQWYVYSGAGKTLTLDGVKIDNYACTSELEGSNKAGIGTFCHEYTHTFGIPDLYDFDGKKNGYSEAIWGIIDLMDAGNLNNDGNTPPYYSALERWFFKMQSGMVLTEGEHTLQPIHKNGEYFEVATDKENEVYLIECRSNEGWDQYIGGSGMMIYHVDMTSSSVRKYWDQNLLNAYVDHQCMDVVECNPQASKVMRNDDGNRFWTYVDRYVSSVFWPDGGTTAFASTTTPAWTYWSGGASTVAISDITKNRDGSVSFKVVGKITETPPSVTLTSSLVLQDACIIRWKTESSKFEGECIVRYKESNRSEWTEVKLSPYSMSHYACVLEGLSPRTSYDVTIYSEIEGIPGPVNKQGAFTTKSFRSSDPPFIYLGDVARAVNGAFSVGAEIPLRLYNAPGGSVEWYFDGEKIQPAANGFYALKSSGTLRAVLHSKDGDFTFTKKVNVL